MRSGADVIFQATLFDGTWMGLADFLERVDRPSELGEWSYEAVDTKVARWVKPSALLQLCSYAEQVALQGYSPEQVHVQLGDGTRGSRSGCRTCPRTWGLSSAGSSQPSPASLAIPTEPVDTYPDPVAHCSVCRWQEVCQQRRRDDDQLSLIAGMRHDQTAELNDLGVEIRYQKSDGWALCVVQGSTSFRARQPGMFTSENSDVSPNRLGPARAQPIEVQCSSIVWY